MRHADAPTSERSGDLANAYAEGARRLALERDANLYFDRLIETLRRSSRQPDDQMITEAAVGALLERCAGRQQSEGEEHLLPSLLTIAARRNLANLNASEERRKKRERKAAQRNPEKCVALDPAARILSSEDRTRLAARVAEIRQALKNPRDQEFFLAWVGGVRRAQEFGLLLGTAHLPPEQQRQEVKRHKDRIRSLLKREGLLP